MTSERDWTSSITKLTERMFDDDFSASEQNELNELLAQGPEQRRYYLAYANLLSALERKYSATPPACPPLDNIAPEQESPATASLPYSFLGNAWHGTIGFFSQEIPFSLLVATVITGLGLLAGSVVYVSQPQPIAHESRQLRPTVVETQPVHECVGRISAMVDVKWKEDSRFKVQGSRIENQKSLVVLGDKFLLTSGLMEITYDTGAKVILEGPVTYAVDSRDGGFLAVGKLTARLEKKGEVGRQKANETVNPKSLVPPLSTIHYPLFTIKTPTATVTDMGTEFGVSVTEDKSVDVQVFRGLVDVQRQDVSGLAQTSKYQLTANEGLHIDHGVARVSRTKATRSHFPAIRRDNAQKLAARYQFDEIHESTSHAQWILDSSGHRLLGALQNTTHANLVPGISGKALELNVGKEELHQCVAVPWSPSFDLNDHSFTIALWLQRKAAGVEMHEIIVTQENWAMPSGGYAIVRDQTTGKLGFRIMRSKENARETFNAWVKTDTQAGMDDMPLGVWVHFVVVGRRDPTSGLFDIQLYHNGIPAGIQKKVEMTASRATLRFCAQEQDAWAFRGLLDDVQIYHRALNDKDVKYLYEHPGSLSPMSNDDSD